MSHQSFDDYIEDFLNYLQLEKGCSLLTVRNYKHYLLRFKDWMISENISPTPENIDLPLTKQFRVYLASLTDEKGIPLKKITQNYHMIAIRSFLRYLMKNDVKTLTPDKIDLPKTQSRVVLALDRDQLYKLLNSVDITTEQGLRDRAILETLFSTGLRVAELTRLDKDKIDLTRREMTIIGKGGRARIVFFSDDAVYWLNRYLKTRTDTWKPLFIRYSRGIEPELSGEKMRLTVRTIQRIVQKYAKIAKISINTTPHVMRHSFATDLLLNGADIRSIQEMLGHKTITTTQIYTNITNKHLKEVHTQFHSGNNDEESVKNR
jgi:site-specific recombinase XerD